MPSVFVIDKDTGERVPLEQKVFEANRDRFDLAPDQVLSVGVEGTVAGARAEDVLTPGGFQELNPEEQLELTAEQVREERHGGPLQALKQFGHGVLAGATFDLSEAVIRADEDTFEKEDEESNRAAQAEFFTAGQLTGAIAPSLLSGGAGLTDSLARMTPAGRLSAATGKIAAGGTGGMAKFGRGALAGAMFAAAARWAASPPNPRTDAACARWVRARSSVA